MSAAEMQYVSDGYILLIPAATYILDGVYTRTMLGGVHRQTACCAGLHVSHMLTQLTPASHYLLLIQPWTNFHGPGTAWMYPIESFRLSRRCTPQLSQRRPNLPSSCRGLCLHCKSNPYRTDHSYSPKSDGRTHNEQKVSELRYVHRLDRADSSIALDSWSEALPSSLVITGHSQKNALPHIIVLQLAKEWLAILIYRPYYRALAGHRNDPSGSVLDTAVTVR